MPLTYLTISYPAFALGTIIDPEEVNQDNKDITDKVNEVVDLVNANEQGISDLQTSKVSTAQLTNHLNSGDHDTRYYTKEELVPYLQGGDTTIYEEKFVVTNPDKGNGTFSYTYNGKSYDGAITAEGYHLFNTHLGTYVIGMCRIEAYINDNDRKSAESGGLIEVSNNSFALTDTLPINTEVTVKYFYRIGMTGEHNVIIGSTQPPQSDGLTLWGEVIG